MVGSMSRNRLSWLILAIALMVTSAICNLLYMDTVGKISGWFGLPGYENYVPNLQGRAMLWSSLAVMFPFLAALLLGFGRATGPSNAGASIRGVISSSEVSRGRTAVTAVFAYLFRVAISALASLAFTVVFIVIVALLERLGVRAH
jgi:hypothetical protein